MKKILAIAAAAALTTGVSVYAANPFSDVSTDDWAYQAISDLSDQGVVEGYPDGTFRGERNMTRFELAQVIARLMAREDQLNAEQRGTLDKLAGEYADELANLGVRVSNLEKKVGNISWSGDARMQYQHKLNLEPEFRRGRIFIAPEPERTHADSWTGRLRINADAQVNDHVVVSGRFVSEMDFKDNEDANTIMDRIHARWTPNDTFYMDLGRQGVALDQTGVFWDEDGVFDGVVAGYDNGKFGAEFGYGRFKDAYKDIAWTPYDRTEAWYGKLAGHLGETADVSAFYLENVQEMDSGSNAKAWGTGATIGLGNSGLKLDGDFIQTRFSPDSNHANLWTAGLNYGEVDLNKPGSFTLGIHYVRADAGSYLLGNSALDMTDQLEYGLRHAIGVKFWTARAGIAVQKNVELDAYYNFGERVFGDEEDLIKNPGNTWGVELNYSF